MFDKPGATAAAPRYTIEIEFGLPDFISENHRPNMLIEN
jgi:hypothetical protein